MTTEEIAEKEAALKVIKDTAENAAELYVAKNLEKFLKAEVGTPDAKALIKQIAQEALDSLEIKEADGKKTALKTLLDEMQDQHDKLSARVKGFASGTENQTKSWSEQTNEGLAPHIKALSEMKDNMKAGGVSFNMKAAGTITIAGNYSGGTVGLSTFDPEFARIQRRRPFMRELVRVLTTDNLYIAWAEQENPDPGVAGQVAEGAAKPQTDFDMVERSAKVEKTAVWIKVSKEALADIKFLRSEIDTELRELVELKLDEQILSGNGTSPNLKGILQYAPAFNGGGQVVPSANRYDVLIASIAQVVAANFMPDTVVLNPVDFYGMQLIKDSQGRYLIPPFMSNGYYTVGGLQVVPNNGVTSGSFLVGDFKKDNLAIREEFNVQIGYVNDDFTKNLVTILAELRAVNYIKTNHVNAFVQGTFIAAEFLLERTT
jgi:HK97 family phage major capsid protein